MGKQKYWLIIPVLALVVLILIPFLVTKKMKTEPTVSKPALIRPPAVADSFYPADKIELEQKIESLLKEAEKIQSEGIIKILIVPHAGLNYSGRVAAAGFKQIAGQDYKRVIILGASHQAWVNHAAVYEQGAWETPLKQTEVDQNLATIIIDPDEQIIADTSLHENEHSLEVELIFLQKVLPDFKIVPILVSQTTKELRENLARKIAQNLDEQTLLVVSTDLSHYPPYGVAKEVDRKTIAAILSGNLEEFASTITNLGSSGYPGLETAVCAHEAVKVALRVGEILKLNYQEIKSENSGDTGGNTSQVVGYAAIAGFSKELPAEENQLNLETQKEALTIARTTLEAYLNNNQIPQLSAQNSVLSQPLGAFVTLRKNRELRGCIGEFEPKEPLYQVIQKMAIAAATKDSRFPPVSAKELASLKIEISVMTPKRKINDWQEIELGKHGVVIQKGLRGGTFLPQVATETGWSKEEFLAQLCSQKAGLPADCYQDPSVNLFVFEAQIFEEE
jgi:hypothetical protein